GTNAFALLEEAPAARASDPDADPNGSESGHWLLPISARGATALRELVKHYRDYLTGQSSLLPAPLHDICHATTMRRTHHRHRLAVAGTSKDDLAARLDAWLNEGATAPAHGKAPGVVFVYPGQGSQWGGMGRQLMAQEPVFRAAMEACDQAMRP